jgi:heat-inducible transcriptional repressor
VVTAPQAARPRLRRLHLVSVHDTMALLLVVLQEASVVQHTLTLERPYGEEELADVAAQLNSLYAGHSADEIRDMQVEHPSVEADIVRATLDLMDSTEGEWFGDAYLEGLAEMLREPEFAEGERILALMDLLEQPNLPKAIPLPPIGEHKLTVIIGSEHPHDTMRQCSVVISRYGGASGLSGTISVVGPTRMHYPKAVSMVRYMDSIMEELLEAYLG